MLKVLWWQAPTLLNPHFALGTKDQDGSRIFYEPLASWDPDGNLVAVLAAELPSLENGGLAEDGRSVTWKLKRGVEWHDGRPFTADDALHPGICARPGDCGGEQRHLQECQGRESRPVHGSRVVSDTTTVLG
jgi:extracellular solute-binding protein (family 5)